MVKIYLENLKLKIKSRLEYKTSFVLDSISQFFVFFSLYYTIIGMFTKFSNIKEYTIYEVLLCFGIIHFGFSVSETFFRGFDRFEDLIIDGSLDRFLVRPQNLIAQVFASEIDFVKIFRILQSIIILIISLIKLNINWSIYKIINLSLMLLASTIIFLSLFILTASYCFITIQGLEVKNILTDGGKHMAQYPIDIYKSFIKKFFTYIIPYAFINYYPLMYFLNKTDNKIYILSPIVVLFFFIISIFCFNFGLKHYSSTGS